MNTLKYFTFFLITAFFSFTACTSEGDTNDKTISAERLAGDWELTSAERDGKETASLEGTYMRFSGKDQLICNFTGEEVNDNYTLKDNKVILGEQNYKIESLSDSELVVSTDLMDFDFTLTFNKAQK